MNKSQQLAKNTIIITISRMSTQVVNFFLLPIYTALLTTEEYGIVDLLNTFIILLTPLITLQLESAVFRFLVEVRKEEEAKKTYISTAIIATIIQSFGVIIVLLLLSFMFNSQYKYYLLTNVVVHVFAVLMLQISRGMGDNLTYALGNAIISISATVLNLVFVVGLRAGAEGILLASFLSNLLSIIFVFYRKKLFNYLNFSKFDFEVYKKFLKYSIPLVPNSLSWWAINASDRIIIASFLGVGANGIYAAANKFSSIFINFYNIFNLAWTESASLYIDSEDRDEFFNHTINLMLRLFLALCIGIIACLPFIFPILVNENFDSAYYHIPILMLSTFFNVVIGLISVVYIALKKTAKVANTSIIAGIINLVVHLLLVNFIGLYAASVSTMISFFILMILRYIDVQKYVKINVKVSTVIFGVLMFTIVIFSYYIRNNVLSLVVLFIVIGYALITNYELIVYSVKLLKEKLRR